MIESHISSRVIKTEPVRWRDLKFIQAENFKEWNENGDQKLLQSIIKYQFIDPFKVWEHNGELFCLDGRHRFLDLNQVANSGCDIPEMLPATFIDCVDMKEAAELVLVYSSHYAKITQQGLYDFVQEFSIDLPELKDMISIPDFSFDRFDQKFDVYDVNDTDEPIVDVTPDRIFVKTGDVFEVNGHRIICGSFMVDDDVLALMQNDRGRIVNCDPPYNLPMNVFTNKDDKKHKDFAMGVGEMNDEQFVQFLELVMRRSIENTLPGAIHYIFMDFRHVWHMTEAARRAYKNPTPKQVCVWDKDRFANGSFYRAQHELCFIFSDHSAKGLWNNDLLDEGGEFYKDNNEWCFIFKNGNAAKHLSHLELKNRIRSNVWKYPSSNSAANPDRYELANHPTPKPVSMIADSILDTTNENDIVIDWFLGSGTSLIACELTKRRARVMDIEPMYIQSAIIRYLNFCDRKGIDVNFVHTNGTLTLADFNNERPQLQNTY